MSMVQSANFIKKMKLKTDIVNFDPMMGNKKTKIIFFISMGGNRIYLIGMSISLKQTLFDKKNIAR